MALAAFPSLDEDEAARKDLDDDLIGRSHSGISSRPQCPTPTRARWIGGSRACSESPIQWSAIESIARWAVQPSLVVDASDQADQLAIFQPRDEDVVRVMDRRQEALAKSMAEGHRVVRGVAGSGKTLVLVYRVARLPGCIPEAFSRHVLHAVARFAAPALAQRPRQRRGDASRRDDEPGDHQRRAA